MSVNKSRLTAKQVEIMTLLEAGNADGSPLDYTQLHAAVSYECSKQAVQCSVKYLVRDGLVERLPCVVRNKFRYTPLALTALGKAYIALYKAPSLKSVLLEEEGEAHFE